jgi:glucokinase
VNSLYLLGIDIGGTKCAVVLGKEEENLDIIDKVSFPTEAHKGFQYTYEKIIEAIERIININNVKTQYVKAIGVSCGGPLDSKRGVILSPPNLPGWDNISITEMLEVRFGIPVSLQNDANACALAEWKFGAAKGYENAIFLTFGTGMGAGLILNGRLYSGTNDMAGEVGHVRMETCGPVGYGKAGSFEGFCSGGGIAQLARLKVMERLQRGESTLLCSSLDDLAKLSAKAVAEAASNGDELAKEIFRVSGEYLGKGLSILIDVLNPEIIVIGSIFARSQELLWPAALKIINEESLSMASQVCRVVPAALGDEIGDYAALAVAANT